MKRFKQILAATLIVSTTHVAFVQTAQATMIGTEQVAQGAASRSGQDARNHLNDMFSRADVQARLENLGVNATDARDRVAALTDEDAARLSEQIDKAPAGGFIEVIIFIFLVLLLTDILGFTKVFPFTRSIR